MLDWIRRGLRTGILTTPYPKRAEPMPDNYRGALRIVAGRCRPEMSAPCVAVCLPGALALDDDLLWLDLSRCVTCGLCVAACPDGALLLTAEIRALGPRAGRPRHGGALRWLRGMDI